MTYSSNSSDRSISAVRADVKIWPQLLPFRQPMSAGHPSRFFVVAVFVSMALHAFLTYLLCVVVADRTAVAGPAAPSIGTVLNVSLVSLPTPTTASRDGLDREVVSAVPPADPPAQHFQSLPERSHSSERKFEAESVMISKDQGVPGYEAPAGKSLVTDTTPSIDLEAAYHSVREVVRIPEFEAEIVLTSKGQGVSGPEAPAGKSLATGTTSSIDWEAAHSIARETGRMSMTEFEVQDLRFKSRALYLKNHLGITRAPRPHCSTAYANSGLFAIPFLLKDTITDSGCTWDRQENRERQMDLGRQKDQERREFMSDLVNDQAFEQ